MNSKNLPSGRLAGVDYGRRRIGISICDAERMIASPLLVHKTTGDRQSDAVFFMKLVEQEEIVGFVVGLPIHSDGRNSEMSSEVEKFANWLSGITKRPIVFQDERHTSQEASGMLGMIHKLHIRRDTPEVQFPNGKIPYGILRGGTGSIQTQHQASHARRPSTSESPYQLGRNEPGCDGTTAAKQDQ